MGIPPDGVGRGRGDFGGTEGGAAGGEQSTEKEVGQVGAECRLECFICQLCLVDPLGSYIPGLWISVCRSSEGHGSDLTLNAQFESAAEFDHQGPRVCVSGIRG